MERAITIKKAARFLGVHPATLRNWEKKGLFMASRDLSGYRRYTMEDLIHLKALVNFRTPAK